MTYTPPVTYSLYRADIVQRCCEELMYIATEVTSRAAYEAESLSFVNALFGKFNIESAEYYQICKYRAILLDTVKWCADG